MASWRENVRPQLCPFARASCVTNVPEQLSSCVPSHNSPRHAEAGTGECLGHCCAGKVEGGRNPHLPSPLPLPSSHSRAWSSGRHWGMCSTVPLPTPSRPTTLHHSSCLLPRHAATDGTCPEILLWEHARELCTYGTCALGSCTSPLRSALIWLP